MELKIQDIRIKLEDIPHLQRILVGISVVHRDMKQALLGQVIDKTGQTKTILKLYDHNDQPQDTYIMYTLADIDEAVNKYTGEYDINYDTGEWTWDNT